MMRVLAGCINLGQPTALGNRSGALESICKPILTMGICKADLIKLTGQLQAGVTGADLLSPTSAMHPIASAKRIRYRSSIRSLHACARRLTAATFVGSSLTFRKREEKNECYAGSLLQEMAQR